MQMATLMAMLSTPLWELEPTKLLPTLVALPISMARLKPTHSHLLPALVHYQGCQLTAQSASLVANL